MRKQIIAGNWKMHKTLNEAKQFVIDFDKNFPEVSGTEVIICPPFPYIPTLVSEVDGGKFSIGAQNVHEEEAGAFTGEVSPTMLKSIGATHAIIGHSERRMYFGETNKAVNKKVHAAFKHGITPILCCGETLEQREQNQMKSHIKKQVQEALYGLSDNQVGKLIIAYEPIWAIGTGKTATSEQANEACHYIRSVVANIASIEASESLIIQYGGSVKPDNIKELLSQSDIDGALVGGASLEVDSFVELIRAGAR